MRRARTKASLDAVDAQLRAQVRLAGELTLEALQVPGLHREVELTQEIAPQLPDQRSGLPRPRLLNL